MSVIDKINQSVEQGKSKGLLQRKIENESLSGANISLDGQSLKNFGSCSFLGMEFEHELKEGVIKAVNDFGTQFSSSRAYASVGLYNELEGLLEKVYNKPVIASATTGMGTMAALPVIVEDNDAVIMDFLVHSTVQLAAQVLKARNIVTEYIPHNSMEHLEAKILKLRNKHKRIWYLADGVYSMHGDYAPLHEIESLLNKYKQLHLFIDDAQGNGWIGENGCGYVRSQIEHHDKMVLCTSLNKSLAAGGGAIIFPNKEMKRNVMNCGGTLVFSGPIQPPMLGASIESVRYHLSDKIIDKQIQLQELIAFTNQRIEELGLPQHSVNNSPIFFISVGYPKVTSHIALRIKNKGFYVNAAGFPAVPMNKSGLRFTITLNLNKEDINNMLTTMQREYVIGINEMGSSLKEVERNFKLPPIKLPSFEEFKITKNSELTLETFNSIKLIPEELWSQHFKGKGNFTYKNLESLEVLFSKHELIENSWKFHYQIVKDSDNQIVLMTINTVSLMMDDLLSDKLISGKVKAKRAKEPYYLTSKWLITGTPFTKGDACFINFDSKDWKKALNLSLTDLKLLADQEECSKILFRDFKSEKTELLNDHMQDQGLLKTELLNNMVVNNLKWNSINEFMSDFKQKYRYSLKKEILQFEDNFIVKTDKNISQNEKERCFNLYKNVHVNALDISVFQLPQELFNNMFASNEYDIIRLYHRDEPNRIIAVMFSHINESTYNAMIVGLDYEYVRTYGAYKQILYQTLLRAQSLNCKKLDLAYTAEMEKKKIGATVEKSYAFMLSFEHYSHTILENLR